MTPAFFSDLHRDYPAAWERFQARIDRAQDGGREVPGAATCATTCTRPPCSTILDNLAMQASDPRFVERLGISRREAVRTAVSVWGGGALLQRAKLRPLPSDRPPRRS